MKRPNFCKDTSEPYLESLLMEYSRLLPYGNSQCVGVIESLESAYSEMQSERFSNLQDLERMYVDTVGISPRTNRQSAVLSAIDTALDNELWKEPGFSAGRHVSDYLLLRRL